MLAPIKICPDLPTAGLCTLSAHAPMHSPPPCPQENLKLSPAMLSRFDLVFLLLDRPDAERDQRLSEHIMALHSGGVGGTAGRHCRHACMVLQAGLGGEEACTLPSEHAYGRVALKNMHIQRAAENPA